MSSGGKTRIIADTASIADGDSIASYLVDSAGALITSTLVGADQSLDVNVTQSVLPAGAATETTSASILAEIAALSHAEDTAHSSGHMGTMPLAVRNDAGTPLAADGDYIPFTTDSTGALRTAFTGTITADIEGNYAEDSAHVSGDVGLFGLSIRNDNQATTFTSASGDYSGQSVDDRGAMWTKSTNARSNLQQIVTVGTTALPLPASPLANRTSMFVQMLSSGQLYLGSATVTNSGATRGIQLGNGGFVTVEVAPGNLVYGVANAAGKDVAVWEFA
jgi:hypothetical protein